MKTGVSGLVSRDHLRQPATFEVLYNNHYVILDPEFLKDWEFMLVHDENRLVSFHAIKLDDEEGDEFNLINHYTDSNEFEVLQIDDPKSKEILRIMPEMIKGIFLYEVEHSKKPDFYLSNIWDVYNLDYDPEIYDKYCFYVVDLEKNYQVNVGEWNNQTQDINDLFKFILPIGRFSATGFPRSDLTEIMSCFAEIYVSVRELPKNHTSIQELINDHYLRYSEDVIRKWDFFFYPFRSNINEVNVVAKEFNAEYDFHFATMRFVAESGGFPTQFLTSSATDPSIKPVVDELVKIIDAILRYRFANMDDPPAVKTLEETGFLELDADLKGQWSYSLIGSNPVVQIEAISNEDYPDGAGHVLLYNFFTGEFLGYGMDKDLNGDDQ